MKNSGYKLDLEIRKKLNFQELAKPSKLTSKSLA